MINSLIAIQKGTTEFSKSKIRRNFKLCLLVIVKKQSGQKYTISFVPIEIIEFARTMLGMTEIIFGTIAFTLLVYYRITKNLNFWRTRGVKGPKPLPIFGNVKDWILHKKNLSCVVQNIYNEYKDEPMVGIFVTLQPTLVIKDPELMKDIMTKDFSVFPQRHITVTKNTEPLSQHLLFLEAARWRPLRNKLSPAFTSGKLKEMFYLMCECANHLEEYLDKLPDNNIVELRELTARFTTDVIGNCAFGIEMNALKDEDSEFRKMGRKIFSPSWLDFIRVQTRNLFPKLYDKLAFLIAETELTNFFIKCIVDTMEYRKKNNIVRHDFVNILMELRDNPDKLDNEIEMTYSLCAAQAFVFFAAGFETSSTTMSSALYELAQHQDVQDRLREEIHEELAKNDGILKYESIKRMKYLHAVFLETLRKHPSALLIFRQNVQPYTFQGTKITIPPKTTIIIPTFAIHHDPEIYPNPNLFDPERFIKDSELANSYNYLAFGKGPRNCIGERFAVCQTKVGLITFLRKYRVEVCEKTQIPYVINPAQFLLAPVGGIHLRFKRI